MAAALLIQQPQVMAVVADAAWKVGCCSFLFLVSGACVCAPSYVQGMVSSFVGTSAMGTVL